MATEFIERIVKEINFCYTEISKWQNSASRLLEIVKIQSPETYHQIEQIANSTQHQPQQQQQQPQPQQQKTTEQSVFEHDFADMINAHEDILKHRNSAYEHMCREIAKEQNLQQNHRESNLGYAMNVSKELFQHESMTDSMLTDAKIADLNKLMLEMDDELAATAPNGNVPDENDPYKIHVEDVIVDEDETVQIKKPEPKANPPTADSSTVSNLSEIQEEEIEEIVETGEVLVDKHIGFKLDTYMKREKDNLDIIKQRIEKVKKSIVQKQPEQKKVEIDQSTKLNNLPEDEQMELLQQIFLTAKQNTLKTLGERQYKMDKKAIDALIKKEADSLLQLALSRPGKPRL